MPMTLSLRRPRGVLFKSGCLFLRIAAPFLMFLVMRRKLFVCLYDNSEIVTYHCPSLTLCGQTLEFVSEFRYLGHIINDRLSDDNDINREIRNMYVRTNMLIRRFGRCSRILKTRLFRTYCACLYCSALWSTYIPKHFSEG